MPPTLSNLSPSCYIAPIVNFHLDFPVDHLDVFSCLSLWWRIQSKVAGLVRVLKYLDSGGFLVSGLAYIEGGSLGSCPHNKKTAEQTEN